MRSLLTACCLLIFSLLHADTVDLRPGMIIRASTVISQRTYALNANRNNGEYLIAIEGNDIVLDLNHALLLGSNDQATPDEYYGLAIRIKKGAKNITIRNAVIHGYKTGIFAEQVTGLTIENCDLGYNWRQRLQSSREKEDSSDQLHFYNDEHDEWLTQYGAGIYLKSCKKAIVKNNIILDGQCALMMTSCEQAEVYDNNFSFNSAIGIGMYRSSNNKIYHNLLDYNIRGYSEGNYHTAQGSAGLLAFQRSNDNLIAFNSVTHCGNGLRLWSGQSGDKPGANDNFIYGNDFSAAANTGISLNYSRNLAMKNIIADCDNGVWAAYCFESDITDNQFRNNRTGIAVSNGQGFNIALNSFSGDTTGIRLGINENDGKPGSGKQSRNFWIAANRFANTAVVYDISDTDTVVFSGNTKNNIGFNLHLGNNTDNIDSSLEEEPLDMDYQPDPRVSQLKYDRLAATTVLKEKQNIRLTDWGPYDFQYPLLLLRNIDSAGIYHFEVLATAGNWQIDHVEGFDILSKTKSGFPAGLIAKPDSQKTGRILQIKYTGPSFTDAFGKKWEQTETGYLFAYREPAINKE